MQVDIEVDSFGLLCPQPIIKSGEALRKLSHGGIIKIIASDPGAISDLKTWCKANRNTYLGDNTEGRVFTIWIQKGLSNG